MILVVKNSKRDLEIVIDELNKITSNYSYFNNGLNYIFEVTPDIDLYENIKKSPSVVYVLNDNVPFLSTRQYNKENKTIEVSKHIVGKDFTVIAGPCSIEDNGSVSDTFSQIDLGCVSMFRGGAYKPRTSPYSFQGLKEKGLEILKNQGILYNKPIVSEIVDSDDIDYFIKYVDIIQVGARNMQNFALLKKLSTSNKPILLKRGFSNTIEELLFAAEYLISGGNDNVILCERGIRNHSSPNQIVLDLNSVVKLKQVSRLPVFVDPSHGSKDRTLVEKLTLAAVAAGADGLLIEVSVDPDLAISDGFQTITPKELNNIVEKIKLIRKVL